MHIAIFVFAAIMTVIPFILHRASLKRQFVSVIILQLVFWLSFICDSFIGFTRSFVAFSEDNYAGGLMVVLFWMLFSSISAISFAGAAVVRGVKYIVSK